VIEGQHDGNGGGRDQGGRREEGRGLEAVGQSTQYVAHSAHAGEHLHDEHTEQTEDDPEA
jgi:hypothetical protein